MDPARGRADIFGDSLEERDDIMVRAFLDLADFFDVEGPLRANLGGVGFRDRAEFGHRLAGEGLDLEPDFEFALFGPNGPHFRQGIAFDHWARIKPPMRGRANTGVRGIFAKEFEEPVDKLKYAPYL